MNPRISVKERNLIKGALRRVFSRSDLRREVIEESVVQHSDPSRPRVKTWCKCAACGKPEAKSLVKVDHILPVVPLTTALEFMTADELIDRIWCEKENLQVLDPTCHDEKTRLENKERRENKKKAKQVLANDTGKVHASKT